MKKPPSLSSSTLFDSTPPPTKEPTPFETPPQSSLKNTDEQTMQDGYLTFETSPEKTPSKNDEEPPFAPDLESFHPLAMVVYELQPTLVNIDLNTPLEVDEDHQTAPQEPPNQNQMAPHQKNINISKTKRKIPPKKAKSTPNPNTRNSKRLRSVVGTKKTNSVDETVYEIPDLDGEPEQTTPLAEKTASPLKPKPKNDKKVSKPSVKASAPKPKPKPNLKDKGKQKETSQQE